MNSQLRNMMAQIESWETAAEFDIPESEWAGYDVRRRSADLYIACLSSVFDALRETQQQKREDELASLAKTMIIYSQSAATRYLSGIEKRLNQLYSAALYYLAGLPATAMLLARNLEGAENALDEESFLSAFLGRRIDRYHNSLVTLFSEAIQSGVTTNLTPIAAQLNEQMIAGLKNDPRKFIAAKLALSCVTRFLEYNVWDALRQYASRYTVDVWQPFLSNIESFSLWELLPSQLVAIRAGLLSDDDQTFSLQMPTSAGKTALCELLIYHEVKVRGHRVLFLVPFRALAGEIRDGMSRRLERAGISVIASHGGNIPTRSETATIGDADVLVITPEKFMALTQVVPDLENQYRTIICDEGHLIDDRSRGLQYELLLSKLRGTATEPRRLIFMSAILPNVNEIHEWLGGKPEHLAYSTYRPVETDYAFLSPQQSDSWKLAVNPLHPHPKSYYLLRFLVRDDFLYFNQETEYRKLINGWKSNLSLACASALKARRNGSVALFTMTRGEHGIKGLSSKLLQFLELKANVINNAPPPSDKLPNLIEFIEFIFGTEYSLSRLLKHGIGFHHGMLPQEVRRAMEEAIHDHVISILLCTTTLAEGVNLPIRTLVVHTVRRYDPAAQTWVYLQNRTIKNIIGRAGRAGKETRGRVLFVNDSERAKLLDVLQDKNMESAHGALYKLIEVIHDFIKRTHISLQNEIFDQQKPWFLALIDSIDLTLLDLIPADTPQQDIDRHIEELLDMTLAKRYCSTEDMMNCLKTVFHLRAEHLQRSVTQETWPLLHKHGISPRLWQFVTTLGLLEHPLWQTLANPIDEQWLNEVILRILELPSMEIEITPDALKKMIVGWMSGLTYIEIAAECECDVDAALEFICHDVGYCLQEHVGRVCLLATERYSDEGIAQIARNWSSLLQFGLGTMQQLDLFEKGCSERLAVWGINRYLIANQVILRGDDLVEYLHEHGAAVKEALKNDRRVPNICANRLLHELHII